MLDNIIKGNGNSRYMKTVQEALSLYPTYEAFMQALIEGTFPFDLNGINAAGWTQIGTMLTKANLLKDTTAALYGLGSGAVPDDVLAKIKTLVDAAAANADSRARIEVGSYYGASKVGAGNTSSIQVPSTTKYLIITAGPQSGKPDNTSALGIFPVWNLTSSYRYRGYYGFFGSREIADPNYSFAKFDGSTLMWYSTSGAGYEYQQFENGGTPYTYIAFY